MNDPNTKSDPISAPPHSAQAKRIEDLEHNLGDMTSMWTAACAFGKKKEAAAIQRAEAAEAGVKLLGASLVEQRKCSEIWADKFDKAEEQLRQIQAALPAERALEMAVDLVDSAADARCADPRVVCGRASKALRAYAAALRKEG